MTHGLHLLTRVALRMLGTGKAWELVSRVGRVMPALDATEAVAESLGRSGSCLSRSMTLAARMHGARVAVGVKKSGYRAVHATRFGLAPSRAIAAHAWIEIAGAPIVEGDPYGKVIADLEPRLDRKLSV